MGYSLTGRAVVSKTVGIGSTPIVPVSSFCCLNKIRIVNRCFYYIHYETQQAGVSFILLVTLDRTFVLVYNINCNPYDYIY